MTYDADNRLNDPLTYYKLIKVAADKVIVFLSIHHILCDGVTGCTLFNEAEEYYRKYEERKQEPALTDGISNEFYNHFHQSAIAKFDTPEIAEYWARKFGNLHKLRRTIAPQPASKYVDHAQLLDPAHLEKVQNYCRRCRRSQRLPQLRGTYP